MPTSSILGCLVTLLDGTLHISYPPTIEEVKLYCHVDTLLLRVVDPDGGKVAKILKLVLEGLSGWQPAEAATNDEFPLASMFDEHREKHMATRTFLYSVFECMWVECDCNERLLQILAPLIPTTEDHACLLSRMDGMLSRNPMAFLNFVHFSLEQLRRKLTDDTDVRSITLEDLNEINVSLWCRVEPSHRLPSLMDLIYRRINEAFPLKSISDNDDGTIPASLVAFTSSLDEESHKPLLAHLELLNIRWPYFKHLMKSGLSEAHTRTISLPCTRRCIYLILRAIYGNGLEPFRDDSTALEILTFGPQVGLFSCLKVQHKSFAMYPEICADFGNCSIYFDTLVNTALKHLFLPLYRTSNTISIKMLNMAHQIGAVDWLQQVIALTDDWTPLLSQWDDLHPELRSQIVIHRNPIKNL